MGLIATFERVQVILSPLRLFSVSLWTALCGLSGLIGQTFFRKSDVTRWVAKYIWSSGMLFLHGIRLKTTGVEKLSKNQPTIIAANHESFADIPLLINIVPFFLNFIAKKELKKLPIVGPYINATGTIWIDRSNREKAYQSMREAGRLIREGKPVITFPEGQRTKDGTLGIFKRGTFLIAIEAGVPVTPIALTGTRRIWTAGTFRLRPGKVTVSVGDPVSPSGYTLETVEDFANEVRERVKSMQEAALARFS
ncbi:MAG: lysophospholipid acyltransferase family protein [Salibacteraceae bacterium]